MIRFLFLLNLQYSKRIQVILLLQLVLALCPSSSTMAAQDVILLLLPVHLHDDREHIQVMPGPTAPTSPRTLSQQLYNVSSKSDVPFVTFPCVQQQQLKMQASTGPRILLAKQLYYDRTRCDSPSASCPIE